MVLRRGRGRSVGETEADPASGLCQPTRGAGTMTGMRRGEVLGLAWDAVALGTGTQSVRRTLVTVQARRAGEAGARSAVV